MSTRACYVFTDKYDSHVVYKHHDGYPSGAVQFIAAARKLAWPLPRFEADEFAASFVAANKDGQGGVRLTHKVEDHGDIEYLYFVTSDNVEARRANGDVLFSWPLADIENAPV